MKIHRCLHIGFLAFIVQCQWLPRQAIQVSFVDELYLTHYRTIRNLWCGPYTIWKSLEIFYKWFFSNPMSTVIPSSYSSLKGSNGISPSSPRTLSTSLASTSISSTLAYVFTTTIFSFQVAFMGKETPPLLIILYLPFSE